MGTPPLATAPPYNDDPNTPRPWYRRPWAIATAMVVVSLVIATVTWWGIRGNDTDITAPPPPAVTPPASNGEQGYLPDTVDRYGQQIRVPRDPAGLPLSQAPVQGRRAVNDPAAGIQWQQIYTWAAAVFTTSDGPTSITAQGIPVGIAHTPQGSVVAASQINARVLYGPPEARRAVVDQLVIGPPAAKQQLLDITRPARQAPAASNGHVDDQYTDTFSRVSMADGPATSTDYPSGQYYSVATMTMVWDAGQWKWRIPDEGFTDSTANVQIESVAGWTRW